MTIYYYKFRLDDINWPTGFHYVDGGLTHTPDQHHVVGLKILPPAVPSAKPKRRTVAYQSLSMLMSDHKISVSRCRPSESLALFHSHQQQTPECTAAMTSIGTLWTTPTQQRGKYVSKKILFRSCVPTIFVSPRSLLLLHGQVFLLTCQPHMNTMLTIRNPSILPNFPMAKFQPLRARMAFGFLKAWPLLATVSFVQV